MKKAVLWQRKTRFFSTLTTIVAALSLWSTVHAWDEPEVSLDAYSTLSTAYVTPHTDWAQPYSGGPLRGFYFVHSPTEGMLTKAREAVELQQRLDIGLDVAFLYNFHGEYWFGGDAGARRVTRLLRTPHDVFIFQDMPPSKLSVNPLQDGRTPFLEQVRAGAGVVLIGADDGNLFTDAVPSSELPLFLAGTGAVKAYTVGKGRIVQMPPRPLIGYRLGWEVEYDLWQEKLVRAVLWAARRAPAMSLRIDGPAELERTRVAGSTVPVVWTGLTPGKAELALRLRRWDGRITELGTTVCEQADGRHDFVLPRTAAGTYHLEAFARRRAQVQSWAIKPLKITASVGIAEITLASPYPLPERPAPSGNPKYQAMHEAWEREGIYTPYVEEGDPITGRVRLSGPASAGQILRISLVAPDDRELVRDERPAALEQSFSFTAESWMPMLLRVEARLLDGDHELAFDYRYQRITRRRQGKFNFVLWAAPTDETLGPYAIDRLADLGVTTILQHTPPSLSLSAAGMSYVPWSGGGGGVILQQVENWQDPKVNQRFAKNWGMQARGAGVLTYSLGDEIPTRGMGRGANTDTYFRNYLREEYDTIEALNTVWDSTFTSFDEITIASGRPDRVKPPQPKTPPPREPAPATGDNPEREELVLGLNEPEPPPPVIPVFRQPQNGLENHAPAYDAYYFPGHNFIEMGKQWRAGVREICQDSQAKIGFEGSAHICRGMADPERVCREFDMWAPYTGISEEFIRSLAPRSFIRSSWIGYDKDATSHLGHYWRQVMMGADSVWYWMWSAIGGWQGFQQPDLDAPEPVREMLRDTQVVREGLGDLLLNYEMQHDGIAMLYSYPSLFVHNRSPRCKTYLSHWAAYLAWQNIIHDLNMQYNFVTETSLANGEFGRGGYKVLILPQVWALSEKTVQAIRQFVADGGTVLADLRPGFYDEHARQREHAALDALFGVAGGFESAATGELEITGELGLSKIELRRPGKGYDKPVQFEPAVTLSTGQALGHVGKTPACIVNSVGKGRAILLNFAPRSTFEVREDPAVGGLAGKPTSEIMPEDEAYFFLNLFHAAGIERAFNFTEYKKETTPFFRNVRVQRWQNGDYQIVGFFRQVDSEQRRGSCIPDSAKWPVSPQRAASGRGYAPPPWVYDIKNGLEVGEANWFIVPVDPGRAVFYAMLPGPLPAMAVDMPQTARRGAPLRIKLSVPEARGLHAIKIRARQPDGVPAKFWEQTVQVGKTPIDVVLPLAFNDPTGEWTITMTDLFGLATAQKMAVKVD